MSERRREKEEEKKKEEVDEEDGSKNELTDFINQFELPLVILTHFNQLK